MDAVGEVTQLLHAWRGGDREAFDRLFPLIYADMRRIARAQLRGREHTLGPTGLVHEVYLKLAGPTQNSPEDRAHFFALAARAMRQVAISYARRHAAAKRGGPARRVTLDEAELAVEAQAQGLLDLDRALERLAAREERLARVVEYRYFGGLSEEECAAALGVSLRTVQRDWLRARAWLREDLGGAGA